jgi:HSP20 family molecular chaperone IbpA
MIFRPIESAILNEPLFQLLLGKYGDEVTASLKDGNDDFIAIREIPGINPSTVEVTVGGEVILVKYRKEVSPEMQAILSKATKFEGGITKKFEIGLPDRSLDINKAKTYVENGILLIYIPALKEDKKVQMFSIPVNLQDKCEAIG